MAHELGEIVMVESESDSTKSLLKRFKRAAKDAEDSLLNEEFQKAMALYYDASQTADEMTERFLTLLVKTSPSNAYRTILVELLSWRLRYYTAQYDYHLSVAQTLSGLPREEWVARVETILVLSQSLVGKLIPIMKDTEEPSLYNRIQTLLNDWVKGIRNLVNNLQSWEMASAQAAQVLEWALDNELESE